MTTAAGGRGRPTTRDRYRRHVREEVKEAALRQLAAGGASAVSINAIAKELGVSGPALYRYFASRDELLTELVVDTYDDLRAAVAAAADAAGPAASPAERVRAYAHAVRSFALEHPHRYRLLFAPPVPGYDAHAGRLADAAHASMALLFELLADLEPAGRAAVPAELAGQLRAWTAAHHDTDTSPAHALHGVIAWSRVHGFVSLELGGVYRAIGVDPGQLFDAEVTALLAYRGIDPD